MTTRGKTAPPCLGDQMDGWAATAPDLARGHASVRACHPDARAPGRGTARARGRVSGASPITARSASMEAMTASASGSTLAPAKPGAPDSAGPDRRRPLVRPRVVICADLVVEIR